MVEYFTGVLSSVIGTIGFCLVLRVRMHRLPAICLSTALCYAIYLTMMHNTNNDPVSIFVASFSAAAISEIFARVFKAPVTVFLIPTILPLVPGAALYYTLDNFFRGDFTTAFNFFATTGKTIGAIILGIIAVTTIAKCWKNHQRWQKNDPTLKYNSGK